jgi:hypothetical protein
MYGLLSQTCPLGTPPHPLPAAADGDAGRGGVILVPFSRQVWIRSHGSAAAEADAFGPAARAHQIPAGSVFDQPTDFSFPIVDLSAAHTAFALQPDLLATAVGGLLGLLVAIVSRVPQVEDAGVLIQGGPRR